MKITITWRNDNPDTIWAKLAERLGREPTDKEAADEVRRILAECSGVQLSGNPGQLSRQIERDEG